MNVVIDEIIAVLQVLTFGNTVGGNQNVNFIRTPRKQHSTPFGNRRETGQNVIHAAVEPFDGRSAFHRTGDHGGVKSVTFHDVLADVFIQVFRRVGECREHQHFAVAGVDGVFDFIGDDSEQFLELGIMIRGYVRYKGDQHHQCIPVLAQQFTPRQEIHVGEVNFDLFAYRKHRAVLLVYIEVIFLIHFKHGEIDISGFFIFLYRVERVINELHNARQRELEGMDGAFQTLEKIDGHQVADTFFTPHLRQVFALVVCQVGIL